MLNWDRLVERKIAQAQQEGKFNDLPGFGQPIENLDEGWDETRWMREKLRAEDLRVMPPAWALRQWAAQETTRLAGVDDETELRRQIETFNAELRDRMRRVLWGPPVDVAPIDVEDYLATRRKRVAVSPTSIEEPPG